MKPTAISERLLDSLLDFIASAPKDEFDAFLRDAGDDPDKLAAVSKKSIATALKTHGERKRAALRAEHEKSAALYAAAKIKLPPTLSEKLALFTHLLSSLAAAGAAPSLQHRDLKAVPEDELDRLLVQLILLEQRTK